MIPQERCIINSQRPWQHAQGLPRVKPDRVPVLRGKGQARSLP